MQQLLELQEQGHLQEATVAEQRPVEQMVRPYKQAAGAMPPSSL